MPVNYSEQKTDTLTILAASVAHYIDKSEKAETLPAKTRNDIKHAFAVKLLTDFNILVKNDANKEEILSFFEKTEDFYSTLKNDIGIRLINCNYKTEVIRKVRKKIASKVGYNG